ncbi:MAG: c-type cytochrome [Pseudomonadota bacterium]
MIEKGRISWLGMLAFWGLACWCQVATAADVGAGSQLYAVHCAGCHGTSANDVVPGTPSFVRQDDFLKPGTAEFEAGRELLFLPDLELLQRIRAGKNSMPSYQGILSDIEILNVIAYLRTLQ